MILPTTPPLERDNYDMVFHAFSVRNHAKWSPAALPKPDGRDATSGRCCSRSRAA